MEEERPPLKDIKFSKNATPEEREAKILKQMEKVKKRYAKLIKKMEKNDLWLKKHQDQRKKEDEADSK